ncbi:type II CAAX endopeptidase family protein [Apibacter raozihei]|uniref:CPBP family intramembrane glutamic endopeptidase n=1 Tax=Apibacter TaxID=1778601 RepID=UPI000FE3E697|nr:MULTISPECIES: type II CAAX endopeptidase family protein [Apibacter]
MNNYLKIYWYDIIFAIVLFITIAGISGQLFFYLANFLHLDTALLTPINTVFNYLMLFLIFYFICLKPREQKFRLSYNLKKFQLFPICLCLFIGQFLLSEFLTGLIPTQGPFFGYLHNLMTQALVGSLNKQPVAVFISICIIAPIFEEIFFRGFILKGMLNNKVPPYKAIIISSIIFGGIHIFPWQVLAGILAGIVLGISFYKTGSLAVSTLLHFLNNLLGFYLYYKNGNFDSPEIGFSNYVYPIIGLIIIIISGYFLNKITKKYSWKYY